MSACVDQELLLGGLVDNELDAANVAMVEAHVARCEGCREELERLQALRNLLRSMEYGRRTRTFSSGSRPFPSWRRLERPMTTGSCGGSALD